MIDYRSIFHWATTFGHEKACLILLEAGADPNIHDQATNRPNPTPLMAAINREFSEVSCLMIEKDVDIHVKDSNARNALWMAWEKNLPQVCKLLIEKKANVNLQDKIDQLTPLMVCALRWNIPYANSSSKMGPISVPAKKTVKQH